MLAPDHTLTEFTLPTIDLRSLARRIALPALVVGAVVVGAVLIGGHVHAVAAALRRVAGLNGGWAAAGVVFECISLAGYVLLLSLVAGRATPRIDARVSAQITFAGAAATRLLPTAGAGGAALALWTLRRAGLRSLAAARTLLAFMVLLYSVFLTAIVLSGAMLAFGVAGDRGPTALSEVPAGLAIVAIAVAVALGLRRPAQGVAVEGAKRDTAEGLVGRARALRARLTSAGRTVGDGVREAFRLLRSGDLRLAGAVAYWLFDAAVLWAMLHAFGAAPVLPVVIIAYFVGQAANTLPIPGSVSGGIVGVLIAFGVAPVIALPAVIAYRTISVWLPTPVAIAAIPGLRSTIARWGREETARPQPAATALAA